MSDRSDRDEKPVTRADLDREVAWLRQVIEGRIADQIELRAQQFAAVELRFSERDLRFAQQGRDHQTALDASLAATTRQIDQLAAAHALLSKNFDERLNDIKDRTASFSTTLVTAIIGVTTVVILIAGLVVTHVVGGR